MERTENEIWRPAAGYEGRYEVSNYGRVRSLTHWHGAKEPHIISQHIGCGYPCVYLLKNREIKEVKVHRLVALAFIPNPKNLPHVNHIDGDKRNSVRWNLEWVTPKENVAHAMRTGLFKVSYGHTVISDDKLHEIIGLRMLGLTYGEIGRMYGIDSSTAGSICKGRREATQDAEQTILAEAALFAERNKYKYPWAKKRTLNKKGAPKKRVIQTNKDGEVIRKFDSITEAARTNGVLHSSIINNLKGRSEFCGGYKYVYECGD